MPSSRLQIDDRLRHDTTIALEQAIDAAKTYDGTEPAYNHLFSTAIAFEQCAAEIGKRNFQSQDMPHRDRLERDIAQELRPNQSPVNVQGILSLAVQSFGQRLLTRRSSVAKVATGFCFIPTESKPPFPVPGSGSYEPPRSEPRLDSLILA